jgi:hypothetical protein
MINTFSIVSDVKKWQFSEVRHSGLRSAGSGLQAKFVAVEKVVVEYLRRVSFVCKGISTPLS